MAPLCLFKIVSFLICVLDYSHIDDSSHVFVFGNVPVHHHPWALFHSSNWTDKYAYRLPHFLSLTLFWDKKNNPFWEPSYIQNMMRKYDMFNVHVSASFDFALSFYLFTFFLRKYFLICDITGLLCSQMTPRISFFLTSLMAIVYLNESKFPPH